MSESVEFILPDYLSRINQTVIPKVMVIKKDPDVNPVTGALVPEYYVTRGVELDETINDVHIARPCLANQDWEGIYKFGISFEKDETPARNTSATYSTSLNKLYVTMGTSSPVMFHTASPPPAGAIIRTACVFLKPLHTSEAVQRCRLHADPKDPTNIDCPDIADHLVRCEANQAMYHCDPVTEYRSVTVPYCTPAEGMKHISFVFRFMCYNSCLASVGNSKRPLQLIFTLEYKGEVIGRRVLNIRICAVPRRDRKKEEVKLTGEKKILSNAATNLSMGSDDYEDEDYDSVQAGRNNERAKAPDVGNSSGNDRRKRERISDDDHVYILRVRGRRNYKMLKYLNDLMQFHDAARNGGDMD